MRPRKRCSSSLSFFWALVSSYLLYIVGEWFVPSSGNQVPDKFDLLKFQATFISAEQYLCIAEEFKSLTDIVDI